MIYYFKNNKIYNVSDIYQYVIVKKRIINKTIAMLIGEPINPNLPYPNIFEELFEL